MISASSTTSFAKQLGAGLGIFVVVLAASVPLAFVSEGLALAMAVAVGSVFLALVAQRLRIALVVATLMAVLGAFAASHSIHLARRDLAPPLAELAPAAGATVYGERTANAIQAAMIAAPRLTLTAGGERVPVAGWLFPGALFALWAAGFAAIALNRALLRWLWRALA
jgi:hypothetical protein